MKQKTRWHDALVLAAVLCAAFLIVTGTQQITGRIDGVASMVFVLAVFLTSVYTDGYVWGVVASLIGVLAEDVAIPAEGDAYALVYVHAAVIASELIWDDGVSAADQQEALDRLCTLAEKLAGGQEILGIGISSGGPMDADKGELCNPPNLPGWHLHLILFLSAHNVL